MTKEEIVFSCFILYYVNVLKYTKGKYSWVNTTATEQVKKKMHPSFLLFPRATRDKKGKAGAVESHSSALPASGHTKVSLSISPQRSHIWPHLFQMLHQLRTSPVSSLPPFLEQSAFPFMSSQPWGQEMF